MIKVLLFSAWLQRLYFIIRASIIGLTSTVVTFFFIMGLGSISATTGIGLGIFVFAFSLFITGLFDVQLTKATKKIVDLFASHRVLRDFIMDHF